MTDLAPSLPPPAPSSGDPLFASPSSRRDFLRNGSLALAASALSSRRASALNAEAGAPLVTTPLGALRGELLPDRIRVFRGIPFAEPPVGELRFRAPQPPKPWTGTRDATRFAAAAMQPGDASQTGSEDCLYLNLWAPAAPGPHPVFLWIHGGGYTGGSSFAPIFDGSLFAREGIVLVTVAYRLGVFGFMDLEPLLGPAYADSGNNALRDLVAALTWVHENISAFGGDPDRVTVGGESAGAKATAALMAIPEARGLFQSAISESGGGERVLTHAEAAEVARSFGEVWRRDHPTPSSSADTFSDLRTASPRALIDAQQSVIAQSHLHFPFRPQIGGQIDGQVGGQIGDQIAVPTEGQPPVQTRVQPGSSLLPKRPVDLVADGSARGKRLLIGTNRDENALFLGPHPSTDPRASDLGNLPLARFNEVLARYTALYPQMTEPERRIRAVTAEEYWIPSVRLADAHTRAGGAAWMYRLDFAEPTGRMAGEAYHSLDLGFVWEKLNATDRSDPEAQRLAHAIHTAWCAFLRGKAPASPNLPTWPEYHPTTRNTMILNRNSHVEQKPFLPELRLWDGVL